MFAAGWRSSGIVEGGVSSMRVVVFSFLLSFCCDIEEGVGSVSGAGVAVIWVLSLVVAVEDEGAGFSSSM